MHDFPQLLTTAMKDRGLTLQQLSDQLRSLGTPVSTATLSYWSTGRSVPARAGSRRAVAHLETLLDLKPGELISGLPGQINQSWQPTAGLHYTPALRGALDAMGVDLALHLAPQLVREHVQLDATGRTMRHQGISLLQALDPVVDHFAVLALTPDPAAHLVKASASHGCTVLDARLVDDDVLVLDVRPDRRLHAGDLLHPRFTVEWASTGDPFTCFRQRMPQPVARRSLLIAFEAGAPSSIHAETTDVTGQVSRLELVPGAQVMHAQLDAPAGTTVLSWTGP